MVWRFDCSKILPASKMIGTTVAAVKCNEIVTLCQCTRRFQCAHIRCKRAYSSLSISKWAAQHSFYLAGQQHFHHFHRFIVSIELYKILHALCTCKKTQKRECKCTQARTSHSPFATFASQHNRRRNARPCSGVFCVGGNFCSTRTCTNPNKIWNRAQSMRVLAGPASPNKFK